MGQIDSQMCMHKNWQKKKHELVALEHPHQFVGLVVSRLTKTFLKFPRIRGAVLCFSNISAHLNMTKDVFFVFFCFLFPAQLMRPETRIMFTVLRNASTKTGRRRSVWVWVRTEWRFCNVWKPWIYSIMFQTKDNFLSDDIMEGEELDC